MGHPPKGMDDTEREAKDALFAGIADEYQRRLGMSVLRGLGMPQFPEQLKPRRGRQANHNREHRVKSHYAILSSPRYRESPLASRGPLPDPEIIKRIARKEGITTTHVRSLLRELLTEAKERRQTENERRRQGESDRAAQDELYNQQIRVDYMKIVESKLEVGHIRRIADFEAAFNSAHEATIAQLALAHGLEPSMIDGLVQPQKSEISPTLKSNTYDILRYRT